MASAQGWQETGQTDLSSSSAGGPRWVLDGEVFNCQMCGVKFDMIKRKHHCRRCGGVFCKQCTPHRRLLPEGSMITVGGISAKLNARNPQRVCRHCQSELDPLQSQLCVSIGNSIKDNNANKEGNNAHTAAFMEGFTLGAEIRKAAYTVKNFTSKGAISDGKIPEQLLRTAQGVAFLHVVKGGLMFSVKFGSGCVIARLEDGGWSAPCALATVGVGWGAQVGAAATNYCLILTSQAAVKSFCGRGQVTLGAELGAAVGPVGRTADASLHMGRKGLAPCYSYSHSKGFFGGISLEGAVIVTRPDVNKNFYGVNIKPSELLSKSVHRPVAARPLYTALAEIFSERMVEPGFANKAESDEAAGISAFQAAQAAQQGAGAAAAMGQHVPDPFGLGGGAGGGGGAGAAAGGAPPPLPPPVPPPAAPMAGGGASAGLMQQEQGVPGLDQDGETFAL